CELHLARALVTDEVVAGDDVVHAQAICAGESLAHVALQQALMMDDSAALAVVERTFRDFPAAGLATGWGLHASLLGRRSGRSKADASAEPVGERKKDSTTSCREGSALDDHARDRCYDAAVQRFSIQPQDGAPMKRLLTTLTLVAALATPAL